MGIFSRKLKLDMESFCTIYYDASLKTHNAAFQQLLDIEPSFSKVDRILFDREITAMQFALFSLAFLNRFKNFDKAVKHRIFMLRYIKEKGWSDVYEAIAAYNTTIADTATIYDDGRPMTSDTAVGRMTITRVNKFRWSLYEEYLKKQNFSSFLYVHNYKP